MLRRLSPFILLAAFLVAAEPLVHRHPLETSASRASANTACAICATGFGPLTAVVRVTGVPQVVVFTYVGVVPDLVEKDAPLPRSPRAPPAA